MRTLVDSRLRKEAAACQLRFGCEHCVYFDEATATCSELFPNDEHLGVALERVESLSFCKRFELL